jgi:hypothetical protein
MVRILRRARQYFLLPIVAGVIPGVMFAQGVGQPAPSRPTGQVAAAADVRDPLTPAARARIAVAVGATAKIAASAGYLDVAGVKLGMPVAEAVAALKTYNAKFKIDAFVWPVTGVISRDFTHLLPTELVHMLVAREGLERIGMVEPEIIEVDLTPYPNAPVVYGVSRHLRWNPGTGPSMSNVVASLRQKYGPETGPTSRAAFASDTSIIRDLYWAYDGQGRLLSLAQLLPHVLSSTQLEAARGGRYEPGGVDAGCQGEVTTPNRVELYDATMIERNRLKSGYVQAASQEAAYFTDGWDETHDAFASGIRHYDDDRRLQIQNFCREITVLGARLTQTPATGELRTMDVGARSVPLMRSAFNASHAIATEAATEKLRKDKAAAALRGVPKF